jgi:hypothetical protein
MVACDVATIACGIAMGSLRCRNRCLRYRNGLLATSQPVACGIAMSCLRCRNHHLRYRNRLLAMSKPLLAVSQWVACDVETSCLRCRNRRLRYRNGRLAMSKPVACGIAMGCLRYRNNLSARLPPRFCTHRRDCASINRQPRTDNPAEPQPKTDKPPQAPFWHQVRNRRVSHR